MTDTQQSQGGALPAFAVFISETGEGERNKLKKIGAAWPNRNGTGFNLVIDDTDRHGRMFLLPFNKKKKTED